MVSLYRVGLVTHRVPFESFVPFKHAPLTGLFMTRYGDRHIVFGPIQCEALARKSRRGEDMDESEGGVAGEISGLAVLTMVD